MSISKTHIASFVSLFICITSVHAQQTSAPKDLFFKYSEFIQVFGEKNWDAVCRFVSDTTKAGFGPNQEGCAGVKRVYNKDHHCWDEMMFALRQGCKVTSSDEAITCVAPPQWADESIVVYLGARAGFTYNRKTGTLNATSLICGGD
ncbi:MAG: hypothetical protein Q3M24_15910 [Candidatus Electrothrix aestuarii]|uniref:Beta/Gamma crystallin n=1 Tax=Candidatus Electrothrix aestuarii TaxID=3062594 RepID=A0AAU8LSA1_9BACT|nr:hypothetical protein [Candidatus Electrothrix aestuarii]